MERWRFCCWWGDRAQVVEVLAETGEAARVALMNRLQSINREEPDYYVGWPYPIGGVW